MTLRVLIVGGYGIFGGRIVELLKDEPRLELIVAGRSADRAKAFCARQHAAATLVPAAFDRNGDDLARHLATLRPDLLVDASGPFQAYGEDRYRVIEACIAARVPYLDLADGADFVEGVRSLDTAARTAGVFALSGVSSFPVLTAAATRRLAAGLARVDAIRGYCALTLCHRRRERHPGHHRVCRPTDPLAPSWADGDRLSFHRADALHHRAARSDPDP
jgi:saccharopine dehydrogenase-like NADP-dependent oxidoreductase